MENELKKSNMNINDPTIFQHIACEKLFNDLKHHLDYKYVNGSLRSIGTRTILGGG